MNTKTSVPIASILTHTQSLWGSGMVRTQATVVSTISISMAQSHLPSLLPHDSLVLILPRLTLFLSFCFGLLIPKFTCPPFKDLARLTMIVFQKTPASQEIASYWDSLGYSASLAQSTNPVKLLGTYPWGQDEILRVCGLQHPECTYTLPIGRPDSGTL